jgi:hypothetical protein
MQSDLQRTAIGDCAASRVSIGRPPHCVNSRGVAGIPLVDLSEALSRMGGDPRLVGATALSGHPNDRCPSRLPIRRRSGPRGIRSGPGHWSARPWGRGGKRRCRPGVEAEGDRLVLRMPDLQAPGRNRKAQQVMQIEVPSLEARNSGHTDSLTSLHTGVTQTEARTDSARSIHNGRGSRRG